MPRKSSSKKPKPRAVAIDFFCGAGGVTRGFIDTGFTYLQVLTWINGVNKHTQIQKTTETLMTRASRNI